MARHTSFGRISGMHHKGYPGGRTHHTVYGSGGHISWNTRRGKYVNGSIHMTSHGKGGRKRIYR
jgi:hypothetical protein